jgi:hypothetical protein
MYEDCGVELDVLPAGGRIFCIGSAGCTALALAARGDAVTAVDVNPAQVAYLRGRLGGSPPGDGAVERLLARARSVGGFVGWSRSRLEAFCALDEPAAQVGFWHERLDTVRFRGAGRVLWPLVLRLAYARELTAGLPVRFDRVLRGRLERGFRLHSNRGNPYARLLLLGVPPPAQQRGSGVVEVFCADAAAHLERAAPGSFDGFSLSNVLDGASPAYGARLLRAVRRAASPGAVMVLRSFGQPALAAHDEWAARDRSLIWGSVRVEPLGGA